MKTNGKTVPKRVARRDLFNELTEGVTALAEARQGKRTLLTHVIEYNGDSKDHTEGEGSDPSSR
jgi:hypothetical protein